MVSLIMMNVNTWEDNSFLLKGLIVISNTIPKIFTNIYVHNDTLLMKNSELIEHILYKIC